MSNTSKKQIARWRRKFNRQAREMKAQGRAMARLKTEWDKLSPIKQATIAKKGKAA